MICEKVCFKISVTFTIIIVDDKVVSLVIHYMEVMAVSCINLIWSKFWKQHLRRLSPFFIPRILINMASGHVSMKYGFQACNLLFQLSTTFCCHWYIFLKLFAVLIQTIICTTNFKILINLFIFAGSKPYCSHGLCNWGSFNWWCNKDDSIWRCRYYGSWRHRVKYWCFIDSRIL